MTVGIISYDYDPPIGGLGIVAKQLVHELKSLNANDDFLTISPSDFAQERVSRIASYRYRKSGGCPLFSLLLFFLLPSIIRRHSLQLLHVHAGSGGVFLLRKPSLPLLVTAHHTYRQEVDFVFLHQPFRRMWKLLMSYVERRTYRFADAITCVSEDTAEALVRDYHISPSKITVIENGVADTYFQQSVLPRDQNRILFVGRLEERKGIWTLLSAFRSVHREIPTVQLELIGSNLIGESLVDSIQKNSLASSVTLRGFVDEEQRIHSMSTATMIVIPSLLEGFGLICAEAMALGCPIVAASVPGLRSLISNDVTGVLVDPCDAQHMSEALVKLLRDPALQSRIGGSARTASLTRFRWSRAGDSLSQIFQSLVKNK